MATGEPAGRKPNRAGIRRREEILAAAERLVREHGHLRVSLQMIADEVGISQPAIHHHFPSRDELFVELLRYRDTHAVEVVEPDAISALLSAASNSAKSRHLAALFTHYASSASDEQHPAHAYFLERQRLMLHYFTLGVQARAARAQLPQDFDARRAATLLLTLSDGLLTRWLIDADVDMRSELEHAVHALGLGTAVTDAAPAPDKQTS
ncbi:TetR/AcrR family transcriptional regulator [Pseudoclavibacter sp. VKM Ac-2888]|uniref:TetR/AcrR family transcriptional regulator n=1 Tax=Pseudoclavibacter sp. VKM Ac-2888 TaxID=2783830 RepID=UPI0015E2CF19|nr:TetR/AcrR family transcriptional regulator [Pseudoclavibacter sp. VKM Ac-2888]MBF4550810.1 TetR/AcrR family transcriptional regulator [Pseudoclavibacter sp. VKM Ac-2888]